MEVRIRVLDETGTVRCLYQDFTVPNFGAVITKILADGGVRCPEGWHPDDDCHGETFIPLHRIICIEVAD